MSQKKCAFKDCKKKIKPIDEVMCQCRCEYIFCKKHRLPEQHHCTFQFTMNKDEFIHANKCIAVKVVTP